MTEKDTSTMFSQFSNDTSLHGVKHISGQSRGFRRAFWILAIVAMLVSLVYIVMVQVNKFTKYPFYTVSMLSQSHQIPFPSVTICNNNQFRRSYVSMDNASQMVIRAMYDFGPRRPEFNLSDPIFSSEATECNPEFFFKDSAHQLKSMFRFCSWQSERFDCESYFTPQLTTYGYCYTFNSRDFIATNGSMNATFPGELGGLRVVLDIEEQEYFYGFGTSTGIKALVHDHDITPDLLSHGFFVGPGTKAAAATKIKKITCLPLPYLAMGTQECWDTQSPNFKSPLKFAPAYDIGACFGECVALLTIHECDCQDIMDKFENVSYCSLRQLMTCYRPTQSRVRSHPYPGMCNCKRQCYWKEYDVSISTSGYPTPYEGEQFMENRNISKEYVKANYLELTVFYQQMVFTEINQVPEYTAVDIVANLGGQLGIFLGASFLTLTEVLEYVIYIIGQKCFKTKKSPKTVVPAWVPNCNETNNSQKDEPSFKN